MAQNIPIAVELPRDLLLTLGRAAGRAGCAPADYLCHLLAATLEPTAPVPDRTDRALRLALRLATDWPDLQHRLRATGHVLRTLGAPDDELSLCCWPLERPLMPLSAFGTSRRALTLRFGLAFPPEGYAASLGRHALMPCADPAES
jgi:hypothetical protein